MKIPFFLLLSLCTVTVHGQLITGTVTDARTEQPVPYANIGLYRKQLGTVTNPQGSYQLKYFETMANDTVRVSSVGYKPKSFLFSQLRERPTVTLEENPITLREVKVKGKGLTNIRTLGNKKDNDNITLNLASNQSGTELGTIIYLKRRPSLLLNANFNIADNGIGKLTFRVNLYRLINGRPSNEKLLDRDIIVTTAIRSGTFTVDLSPHKIVLDQDFLLALEWVKTNGSSNQLSFNAGIGYARNDVYVRYTSQSNWVREDEGLAGMKPKISFFVAVND